MTTLTEANPGLQHRKRALCAFSLVEAVVAVGISLATLGAVLLLNAQQLRLVKSARESNAASFALQDRIEKLRTTTWKNLTDANYVRDKFLTSPPPSAKQLSSYTERLTVTAWPDASASNKILVEANSGGTGTILLSGQGLPDQRQAKVDISISWLGKDRRSRERMFTTVISNSGVNKTSLPAFGGPAGGNWSTPVPTDPGNGGSSSPTATPAPATPTPAPTDNGNGNGSGGNGKGRGNAGGKGGKG
jgi:hypothetical protein